MSQLWRDPKTSVPQRRGCFTRFTPALSKLCQRLSLTSSTSSPSLSPRCSTGQSALASSPWPLSCLTPMTASSPPAILTTQSTQKSTEPTGQTQSACCKISMPFSKSNENQFLNCCLSEEEERTKKYKLCYRIFLYTINYTTSLQGSNGINTNQF